jgi:salicylate hydroxylase
LKNQHIVIAGGGIGGLAAAYALARAGQHAAVCERAAEFADVGAGIQLGPNAVHVLAQLGLRDAALARACLPESIVVRHAVTGRSISRILLGRAVRERYGEVYASVHRADLHAALLQAALAEPRITLHTGEAVSSVSHPADNAQPSVQQVQMQMQIQTTNQTLQADALIAADGVWSPVRQAVFADGAPRATGHAAYRVLLPMKQVPAALQAMQVGVWWAPDVHVVHYPVRGGEFLNVVVLSQQSAAQAVPGWASAASHADVASALKRACPLLGELLHSAQTHQHTWHSWHLYDRPAARSWVSPKGAANLASASGGRVALLGDAAHPMLPYLAQGAAMALEDAAVLAQQVARHSEWPAALQSYQQLRKPRTERVVATARRNGHIFHLAPPWSLARDAVLTLQGTQVLGLGWLYGHKV